MESSTQEEMDEFNAKKAIESILKTYSTSALEQELWNRGVISSSMFQEACNLTEAPIDEVALVRWKQTWKIAISKLTVICGACNLTKLDVLKKYAAYGKIPDDLSIATPRDVNVAGLPEYTIAPVKEGDLSPYRVLHALLGIQTEVEELLGTFTQSCLTLNGSKNYIDETDFDKVNIGEEIGDCLWYLGLLCNALGLSLQTIMETNHEKLMLRYRKKCKEKGQAVADQLGLKETLYTLDSETGDPIPNVYSDASAKERDLTAERELLESRIGEVTGTYTLSVGGKTTEPIPASASFDQIQEALEKIKSVPAFMSDSRPALTEQELEEALYGTGTNVVHGLINLQTKPAADPNNCPDCGSPLSQCAVPHERLKYCPKCEPDMTPKPDPSKWCSFCDEAGHDRSECQYVTAPKVAADLLLFPIDDKEEDLSSVPSIDTACQHKQTRKQADGSLICVKCKTITTPATRNFGF